MSKQWIGIVLSLLICEPLSAADAPRQKLSLEIDATKSSVEFYAVGRPSFLKVNGKSESGLSGNFVVEASSVSGHADFVLEGLQTGIELRDKHMKEKYLEIQQFPKASLVLDKMEIPQTFWQESSKVELPFHGKLTLHNKTQSVEGKAQIDKSAAKIMIEAEFSLKISDFAIAQPGFMNVTLADEVKVVVTSSLR